MAFENVVIGAIKPGKNPRTYFDPKELDELAESIRAQGVLQPVLLRTTDDGLELVAGERRLRAAKMVFGDEGTIPAMVQTMSDEEAASAALNENVLREDMSPAEESDAAAHLVASLNGDRDEVARRLGWSRSVLDKRLILQHATASVRLALTERKILLGHAELLAAAPAESQEKALQVILTKGASVADLRANLLTKTKRLSTACFDKADCVNCHHNSDQQMSLLETNVGAGFCTDWGCFEKKTADHVGTIAAHLEEEVPNVRILEMGDTRSIVTVSADDLGPEQVEACKGCSDFGATVSKLAGSEGAVSRSQCFNPSCHVQKAAAFLKSNSPEMPIEPAGGNAGTKPGTTPAKPKAKASPAASANSIPNKVEDYRYGSWRSIIRRIIGSDGTKAQSLLLALLLEGDGRDISATKIENAWETMFSQVRPRKLAELLNFTATAEGNDTEMVIKALVASMIDNIEKQKIPILLTHLNVAMSDVWKISADYLNLLTKSEMEALAAEIGLKAHLGDKFSKLFSGKRDEIIQKFLKVDGFDYTGIVPKAMRYEHVTKNP